MSHISMIYILAGFHTTGLVLNIILMRMIYCHDASALVVEESNAASINQYIDLVAIYEIGVSKMFNRFSPLLVEYMNERDDFPVSQFYQGLPESDYTDAFGQWAERLSPYRIHYHEQAEPFSVYKWELGVHIPCLVTEHLMATQQFDLALQTIRQMYDPRRTSPVNACWSFPPFQKIAEQPNNTISDPAIPEMTMDQWQKDKANTHAAARANPRVYMTYIVMKYIEILVALGDGYFRRETLEAIPLAIQMYVEAAHICGPQPTVIPQLGKRSALSYADIQDRLEGWNAEVDLELDFPFYVKPEGRGATPVGQLPSGTITTGFFCIPGNPALVSLRDMIDDRLYKIRNGMDINGNKRILPLYEPPIEPGALVRAAASGAGGIAGLLSDLDSPMPRFRFRYLISRAGEIVTEARELGEKLLSCKEMKDEERLSVIRTQHQSAMVAIAMRAKERERVDIEKSIEVLQIQRASEEMHLRHLLALTGDDKTIPATGEQWKDIEQTIEPPTKDDFRMSKYDRQEVDMAEAAQALGIAGAALKQAASIAAAVPQMGAKTQPTGLGVDVNEGGQQISGSLSLSGSGLKFLGRQKTEESQSAARKANAIRLLQDRRLEANSAGRELMRIDKDVERLRESLTTWDVEVKAQQQEINNAAAEEEWMRTKYTSEQFYALMDSTVSTLFRQTFLMAVDMIKGLRRAMDFELGLRQPNQNQNNTASIASSWETCRDGLLSGEALTLELQRLQTIFETTKPWDYEIYRLVSLRETNPRALLELRETGSASFELKESLFDRDFPGHYCRRLMETRVSFPGAPRSLSCTLSLAEHKYRISATSTSYAEQRDEDFRTDKIPIQSIVGSKSDGGNGKLEPTFDGTEQYFPFEGAGAISKWHIQLADELRQFDYACIRDVELDINYGAIAGGDQQAALDAAAKDLSSGSNVACLDVMDELNANDTKICNIPSRLPYITSRGSTTAKSIELFLKSKDNGDTLTDVNVTIDGKEL